MRRPVCILTRLVPRRSGRTLDRTIIEMHLQPAHLISLALAFWLGMAAHCAAQAITNTNGADVIEFGVPHSTLIISGQFLATFAGGGGATSNVKPGRVFKAPKDFRLPEEVIVYWTTHKEHNNQLVQSNAVAFLFFLRPAEERGPTEYRDVTGEEYGFVRASQENVRLLTAKLKEKR